MPFGSIRRMNTVWNTVMCQSLNTKVYRATISCAVHCILDPLNFCLVNKICPAITKHRLWLAMWLQWQLEKSITEHTDLLQPRSICIYCPNHKVTGGKLNRHLMVTTLTRRRVQVHFGYLLWLTGGAIMMKHIERIPIYPLWHWSNSLYHCFGVEASLYIWRDVLPWKQSTTAG